MVKFSFFNQSLVEERKLVLNSKATLLGDHEENHDQIAFPKKSSHV